MRKQLSIPKNLCERMKQEAQKLGTTESNIVVMALSQFFILQRAYDLMPNVQKPYLDMLGLSIGATIEDELKALTEDD